jgi:hypothetical protein
MIYNYRFRVVRTVPRESTFLITLRIIRVLEGPDSNILLKKQNPVKISDFLIEKNK